MRRDVSRGKAEPLTVGGAALQLVGRDVGQPLLERVLLDGVDTTLCRLLGARRGREQGKDDGGENNECSGTHLRRSLLNPVVPHARRHFAFVKMLFGILTWTPTLPSTSCVMATSAAILES